MALTGIAGAAIAIGSLLPWATVTTPFGTIDVAGTHGDGQITVILGIVLLAVAFVQWTGGRIAWFHRAWFPTLLLGGAAAAISGYDMVNLSNRIGEVASGLVHADIGVGLYIVVGGGILGVVAALTERDFSS